MATITIDRNGTHTGYRWPSPEAAFDHLREKRIVPRAMAKAFAGAVVPWVAVLEFQTATADDRGDGWVHAHILFPAGVAFDKRAALYFLARNRICGCEGDFDFEARRVRDVGLHVTAPGEKGKDEAINYLAGYVAKADAVPSWALKRRRLRTIDAARAAGILPFAEFCRRSDIEPVPAVASPVVRGTPRTIGERVQACGASSVFLEETTAEQVDDGEVLAVERRFRFVGRTALNLRQMKRFAKRNGYPFEDVPELKVEAWIEAEAVAIETFDLVETDRRTGEVLNVWEDHRTIHKMRPAATRPVGTLAVYVPRALAERLTPKHGSRMNLSPLAEPGSHNVGSCGRPVSPPSPGDAAASATSAHLTAWRSEPDSCVREPCTSPPSPPQFPRQ